MSYKSQPMVHPFTFFIVNSIQTIYNDVAEGPGNYREALKDLYWLTCFLDSKGQQTLENDMVEMEAYLDGIKPPVDAVQFRKLLKKIMKELHEEGYFLAAKMRPPTRESSMQDLEITVNKAMYGSKD